ncbi:homogentisate 1,2-dioxygenase [Sphingomonas sp. RHCKR47]|uniref:homogentisate 1,2-dioxygenase n=1 Tax=Sphingomonas citricola TaxID=2862498 RepID=UPI001CA5D24E|nr:homogentisate 1,2-dioxygenase [Sphingomonas citricola]MBW6522477.1 homogentisate 1,2-dioxygenase [Sphingomonas citricola]
MVRFLPTMLEPLVAGIAAAVGVTHPAAAAMQDPATDPGCVNVRVAIPPELSHWSQRTPLTAGNAPRNAPVLGIARAADLRLAPLGEVQPRIAPGKTPPAGSYAGLVMFQVTRPGTYRVALGQKAWIDVVRGRAGVASSAHAMGPRCTGVAKLVDFPLRPGRYVMQLTGAPAPTLPATIVRVK